MVSALVPASSGPGSSLGEDTVSCSWARHLTPTVPLSTQEYKWVPANRWRNLTNCRGVTYDGLASRQGVEILLTAPRYRNRMSSGSYKPVGSKALYQNEFNKAIFNARYVGG